MDLYYNEFTSTLKKHQNHEDSPHWLNDLFGEIQRKVADQCDAQEIEHQCEILTISVVHFSGLCLILPKYGHSNNKYVFTAALKFLLEEPMWSVSVTQVGLYLKSLLHSKHSKIDFRVVALHEFVRFNY